MKIAKEEIFGPVISVFKFKDVDEVIARANNTEYGLAGSVFTNSMPIAKRVVHELEAGLVGVNTYFGISPNVPFGGYKQSGNGREMGEAGLLRFLETKTVVWDCN